MKNYFRRAMRVSSLLVVFSSIVFLVCGYRLYEQEYLYEGIAFASVGAVMLLYTLVEIAKRNKNTKKYMKMLFDEDRVASGGVFSSFPLPICILHIDGNIIWANDDMTKLVNKEDLYDVEIESLIPSIKWGDILKSSKIIDKKINIGERVYNMRGEIIKSAEDSKDYSVYLFFIDRTKEERVVSLYHRERPDVAMINIDNYDYLAQKTTDSENQTILYQLNRYINEWVKESDGVVKKMDRDRYFVLFAHEHLAGYTERKFNILQSARNLGEEVHIPVSLSIGIGTGGNVKENETNARGALEMALGRGGDQVSVMDGKQYKFYGGKTKEFERGSRVRTRAVASAVKDFITGVDKVVLMGHRMPDFDCFGAAMGLQRAVRALGKTPYIVCDNMSAVGNLYEEVSKKDEYEGMFVGQQEVLELTDENTLLIILDTHRPSMLPVSELLGKTSKKIIIDHHRRAADFIDGCSLVYHEAYASSACEMVTEILQYINMGDHLNNIETSCLYMGILLDTKNFILKTGERTFDAAAYLKRHGLDTVAVKRMFNVEKSDYKERVTIVSTLENIADTVAVAVADRPYKNIRVVAAQAADDMLNIEDVRASFVIYVDGENIGISGRSLGDVNVQIILEMLGGGGHLTIAGAQLKNTSIEEAKKQLSKAVKKYFEDNKA